MNSPFLERLPLRVGALAGLVVGAVSLLGSVDPWVCLLRAGAAFLLFALAGLALRAILGQGAASPPETGRGRNFDQTLPKESPAEPDAPQPAPNAKDGP